MSLGGDVYLAITIDVEEDNWSNYGTAPVLTNIPRLLELQRLFDRYAVKPTYLITYPVASDKNSVSMLRKIMEDGRCEIGAHLHPWYTPPFDEEKTVRNTMLFNLPKELQYKKIESLHEKILENFNMEPVTFRSGRWGFDQYGRGEHSPDGLQGRYVRVALYELGKIQRSGFFRSFPDAGIPADG